MKTILVVDDSATMLKSLELTLKLGGFDVVTASDGVQALARLDEGLRPDLILTDINMPNMDGLELIQHARQRLRFTPILALTTKGQSAKRERARELGATGWLLKPTGGSELVKLIEQLVTQAA